MRIKKGDMVEIISGKDLFTQGKVLEVDTKKNRVIVENVNIVHRHTRANQEMPQGGIVEKEASIHVSNVQLVCPRCDEKTRVGVDYLDNKKKVRVCKKCQENIDK